MSLDSPEYGSEDYTKQLHISDMGGQLTPTFTAVMGATGVEESYFVQKATGQDVVIRSTLHSCQSLLLLNLRYRRSNHQSNT